MTAKSVAMLLGAKRAGKGKWRAPCPVHGGKRSGPLSIVENVRGVGVYCHGGCSTRAILDAIGLRWSDLIHDAEESEETKQRLKDMRRLRVLDRDFSIVLWLLAIDRSSHRYWSAAARRIWIERRALSEKAEPELHRARKFHEAVESKGWDVIWDEYLRTDSGKGAARLYGSTVQPVRWVRLNRISGEAEAAHASHELRDAWRMTN